MNKKLLLELKQKLEKAREEIENQLKKFAKEDKNLKGDWDTQFPKWDGDSGGSTLESAADQVEEYSNLLSVEYSLENKLKDINLALEKIKKKKGEYGKCENCKGNISEDRLKAFPEAKTCSKCKPR